MSRDEVELELKQIGLSHLISDSMVSEIQNWVSEPD